MTREQRLIELAYKYPTDKTGHLYWPIYGKYLPQNCRSLLEVGVAQGYSLQIWNEFYGENEIDIHALDLFINPNFVSARWCRNKNFVPHIGDQSSLSVLSAIKEQFSVITEDGSHRSDHQVITFKHLFINNLLPSGVYFLEDTLCGKDSFYWGGEVKKFEDTALYMFQRFKETGKIENVYFNDGESNVFQNLIETVEIEANDNIIVIIKKP